MVITLIQLTKITKQFTRKKKSVQVLSEVNLCIHRGDIFGVIGYSGAGKSTLLRLMNGLESPTSGSVQIDNQNLPTLTQEELRLMRQKTGMIFQHFHLLWSRTVGENVAFPLEIAGSPPIEMEEKVNTLLERVGLMEYKDVYPAQLSGGQKQRVGIARALANDPYVLLCDEATSALDTETTSSIIQLLKEIHQEMGITIVFVSHEMDVVRSLCNKVAVMEKGRIVEVGEVADVLCNPTHAVTKQLIKGIPSVGKGEQAC